MTAVTAPELTTAVIGALVLLALVLALDWAETGLPRARLFRPLGLTLLLAPVFFLVGLQIYATNTSGSPLRSLALVGGLHVVWLLETRLARLVRRDVEDAPLELAALAAPVHLLVAGVCWIVGTAT